MTVIKNFLYNAGYNLLALILPLITSPYIARVLLPAGVGANAYTSSLVQYFVLLAALGINMYGDREIAYSRDDQLKMSQKFWEIQILKTFTTLFAFVMFALFINIYHHYTTLLWVQSINIIAVLFDVSWLYMGLEDFKRTVLRNTLVKITSLILILTLVKHRSDVALYILIMAGATLVGNLTLWSPLRHTLLPVKWKELHIWQHFWPVITMFIPQIAISIYVQLNKTMLGFMIGAKYSGFYQNADNLVKMVLSLGTSLGIVMLPHMSAAFSKGDEVGIKRMLYRSFDILSLLSFAMAFGLAAISYKLAPFFYGKDFAPVGPAMMIESIVIIMISWSDTIGHQYLVPANNMKDYTTSVILGSLVNLLANFLFIKLWGLNGAMWATVLSETTVTTYQLWCVHKIFTPRKLFENVPKYLIAGIIMFVVVFWMNLKTHPNVITLGFQVIVGAAIYGTMVLILKPTSLKYAISFFKRKSS